MLSSLSLTTATVSLSPLCLPRLYTCPAAGQDVSTPHDTHCQTLLPCGHSERDRQTVSLPCGMTLHAAGGSSTAGWTRGSTEGWVLKPWKTWGCSSQSQGKIQLQVQCSTYSGKPGLEVPLLPTSPSC